MMLIKALSGYEEAIIKAAERYEPSIIARYLITVATAFNKFYHDSPILQADEKKKKARLVLVDLTQT
jgi:arginyl-tRNA synthetase